RAAEWQLEQPAWSGRLRVTARGSSALVRLEDSSSGELFAQAPVEEFPGMAVESVTDSSRYFVLRVQDGNGASLLLGVMPSGISPAAPGPDVPFFPGFASGRWVRQQSELARQAQQPEQGPKLDLAFKEGQTIKLHIANVKKKEGASGSSRPRPAGPGGLGLLPPPPGGKSGSGERPAPLPGTPIADPLLSWPQPAAAPAAGAWGDLA
ncbi:NECP2 protein, partial [Pteruthius melanotis]|nr:NECP2 protein [Pteruthius melanotis]